MSFLLPYSLTCMLCIIVVITSFLNCKHAKQIMVTIKIHISSLLTLVVIQRFGFNFYFRVYNCRIMYFNTHHSTRLMKIWSSVRSKVTFILKLLFMIQKSFSLLLSVIFNCKCFLNFLSHGLFWSSVIFLSYFCANRTSESCKRTLDFVCWSCNYSWSSPNARWPRSSLNFIFNLLRKGSTAYHPFLQK